MIPFLRSLRFRLLAVTLVLAGIVAVVAYNEVRVAERADQRVDQVIITGQQRSSPYILSSLARRFSSTQDEATRQNIQTLIQNTIEGFEANQDGLRHGNPDLELIALDRQELVAILDELDAQWLTYRSLLEDYLAADPATQAELETRIDSQSVSVFTYADRLEQGLDEVVEQEHRSTTQLTIALVVATVVGVLFAIYAISQIIRSTNVLSHTASQLATGDLKARSGSSGVTELDFVGEVFNNMAGQIEQRIADTEAARAQAEHSDKVKSAFLASMSHELRTPLNAIINFTKFVAKGDMGPVNEQQEEALYEVIDSSRHLLNLINDVLDMSKIESGSLRLFVDDNVNVNSILDNVVNTSKTLLAEKPVELHTEIDPNLPLIRADRQRILQILLNITSNACKFTEQGSIKIHASQLNGEVLVRVEDTGPGIAPEDQALVFEPFKQTASGLRKGSGTGLGMPISKNLAEIHGGRLWLDSAVDKGSTFFVAIPVRAEHLTVTIAKQGEKV